MTTDSYTKDCEAVNVRRRLTDNYPLASRDFRYLTIRPSLFDRLYLLSSTYVRPKGQITVTTGVSNRLKLKLLRKLKLAMP